MGEPLPQLSVYVLIRSTLRMWLAAVVANLLAAFITHQWLGARLRALSAGKAPRFDGLRWLTAQDLQRLIENLPVAAREAYPPFALADSVTAAMQGALVALSIGFLMRAAPSRIAEALALGHVFWLPVAAVTLGCLANVGFLWLIRPSAAEPTWLLHMVAWSKVGNTVAAWSSYAVLALLGLLALVRLLRPPER